MHVHVQRGGAPVREYPYPAVIRGGEGGGEKDQNMNLTCGTLNICPDRP